MLIDHARTLSFLSNNIPRHRRGRIAHRMNPHRTNTSEECKGGGRRGRRRRAARPYSTCPFGAPASLVSACLRPDLSRALTLNFFVGYWYCLFSSYRDRWYLQHHFHFLNTPLLLDLPACERGSRRSRLSAVSKQRGRVERTSANFRVFRRLHVGVLRLSKHNTCR